MKWLKRDISMIVVLKVHYDLVSSKLQIYFKHKIWRVVSFCSILIIYFVDDIQRVFIQII